jgi:hypothetical protein
MTENKLLAIFLFTLFGGLALILGYFFLWPDSEPAVPPAEANAPPSVAQAEREFREARAQRETRAGVAEQARARANGAKEQADILEQRAKRNGVDINDPNSQTAKARKAQTGAEQDADEAERLFKDADERYKQAERNLAAARNSQASASPAASQASLTSENPEQGSPQPSTVASWLPTSLAVLSLIFVLTLFWWTWKLQKDINATTEDLVNKLRVKQSEKYSTLYTALDALKDVPHRLARLQDDVARVGEALHVERQARLTERRLAADTDGRNVSTGTAPYAEPLTPDVVDFPIAAESFLARVGGARQIVKHDHLKGMLVRDPEERGQLVLVRDHSVPDGQLCIVPRVTRFRAAQDFHNHYEKFYDCDSPGAGEVWVVEPAVVRDVEGGWELRDRGILEIKF